MRKREEFVLRALEVGANLSELCREYGVSRKSGYKWLARFRLGGVEALKDMSRRPQTSPVRLAGEATLRILELKSEHPRWGPKKLHRLLIRSWRGAEEVPSVRTVARVLERAGMVAKRRRRRAPAIRANRSEVEANAPNVLWTADFKGWWRTHNGQRCEPLTVRDGFSRFVLCVGILGTTKWRIVQQEFEKLFELYGLPQAIRVDNGSPFGCVNARGGLTKLSAWWVSLGIQVVFGRPGHPQDNGAHERMHADMRDDLELHPQQTPLEQQRACDYWRHEFNQVRPHEALGQRTPADLYHRSPRQYRGSRNPRYPDRYDVRSVDSSGHVCLDGRQLFISRSLVHYQIGLQRLDDERARVWFYDLDLGEVTTSPNAYV